MDQLRISATANGLNYLPEYLADVTGIFAEAGLAVTARDRDPWTGVLDDLESGAADLALGGLWVPGMYAGGPRRLTVVGQVNHTCPKVVLGRAPDPDFTLADLRGKTVLAPGAGGSGPYAVTAGLIREAGVDPDEVRFVRDLSGPMLVELFHAGLGDAIVLDLVTAIELERAGRGHVVYRHLESGGLMPNSVYYCRTDRVEELRDRITRFVSCLATSMARLPGTPAETVDGVLAARWPGKDITVLREAVAQMRAGRTWETVAIDPAASDRWMRMLAESQMVVRAPGYAELADDSFMKAYR
ncbi:ABC transporter substrate-binding protein [Pseudonocardia oroxyli]|uniref:Thiamine pyrimidine synthase n=1 Tax=Pseudonocardia oroxyli TaxID=366584 RepID=A0A1G7XUF8_PSEOR|nr:ABC transporter substrate-binding protein [Pseudonocardia oroxyli]SDG87380.1 NitT/TauT family transport system substrate-binding protein [Pseudonocardia oroxyli]